MNPRRPPKPRQHRNGKASRGRVGLVVVFGLLRIVDVFFLLALPTGPSSLPFLAIILAAMWTTAVLIAIWRRQQWARIIMIGLFILVAIAAMVLIPTSTADTPLLTAYVIAAVVSAGSSAWLLRSRDVRRLTSRERE